MAQPLAIPFPPNLDLWDGCQIFIHAVDPSDGSTVGGIQISNVSIEADQLAGELAYGPFMLVTGPKG